MPTQNGATQNGASQNGASQSEARRNGTAAPAPTQADIDAADRQARLWDWPEAGPLPIGSDQHREAVVRMFRETFNPYKPSVIEWPKLNPEELHRLTSLPIWDIAVSTENKAMARMRAYGESMPDPAWREAIVQNAWEEGRHREVLANLVTSYGIKLAPETHDPLPEPEWGYLVTGFSECIDSFFAFGLFALARQSGFFPPALVETFEPVIQEEARHILLFANWVAWHRKRLNPWRRILFELRVARVWIFLGWERMGIARDIDGGEKQPDYNFTVNGTSSVSDVDLKPLDLMALCLEENDRRFAGYDERLLRPTTTPALARWALRFGRLFGHRPKPVARAALS